MRTCSESDPSGINLFLRLSRLLRKCQTAGRVSVLAGCRVALLPLYLLTETEDSCLLCLMQLPETMFSFMPALLCSFPRDKAYCLGSTQVWQWFRQHHTTFFFETFALCSLLCIMLAEFSKAALIWEYHSLLWYYVLNHMVGIARARLKAEVHFWLDFKFFFSSWSTWKLHIWQW